MSGDASARSIWTSIFSRNGGSGSRIRIWDDWDDDSRAEALRNIDLQPGELPVILAKSPSGVPIVLSSRRLFCLQDVVDVQDIVHVKSYGFPAEKKDELSELDVELKFGRTLRLSIDQGPPYFALWNVLLHISRKNARTDQKEGKGAEN